MGMKPNKRGKILAKTICKYAQLHAILRNAGGKCHWCRKPLTVKTMTIEHLIPKSKGGSEDPSNLTAACSGCNNFRDNRTHLTAEQIARRDDGHGKPVV